MNPEISPSTIQTKSDILHLLIFGAPHRDSCTWDSSAQYATNLLSANRYNQCLRSLFSLPPCSPIHRHRLTCAMYSKTISRASGGSLAMPRTAHAARDFALFLLNDGERPAARRALT